MVLKNDIKQEITGDNKPKRDKRGRLLPGNTANPNGKPEGAYSLLAILKRELQKCPEGQDKKSYGELIVRRMLKEAIEKGDVQQIKLIWAYIEGQPIQKIAGADGKNLIIGFDPIFNDSSRTTKEDSGESREI